MAGTITKQSNNSYRLQYMCNGVRYRQTIKASSDKEASIQLAKFVTEVEKGQYFNCNFTFTELAQLFIDKYANDNLAEYTVLDYKYMLNSKILKEIGYIKIRDLRRIHIQEFANKLLTEYNLSSKTIKNNVKLISSILSKGVDWELLDANVADRVSIPKNLEKPKKKVVLYSYDELQQFLKCLERLEDKQLQLAIYTSLLTGARRGEVLALTFDDFNFKRCSVDINKSKSTVRGTKIKDTKTGKNRQFYVPRTYLDKVEEYYDSLFWPSKETELFNYHPDTYSENFKKFLSENNLREINLKDLRALNESILVNQGMDIVCVAKRLGHLPSTAANYYLDQIPEEDKKASKILENIM